MSVRKIYVATFQLVHADGRPHKNAVATRNKRDTCRTSGGFRLTRGRPACPLKIAAYREEQAVNLYKVELCFLKKRLSAWNGHSSPNMKTEQC